MKKILFIILLAILIFNIGCISIPPSNTKIQIFNESYNCTSVYESNIYYNNVSKNLFVCNGTDWRVI